MVPDGDTRAGHLPVAGDHRKRAQNYYGVDYYRPLPCTLRQQGGDLSDEDQNQGQADAAGGGTVAVFFNFVNAGFLGYFAGTLQTHYDNAWLTDTRFITGLAVFLAGALINITSDQKLIHLRKKRNGDGYVIPRGGLFEKVSCPNFLGEIIEWGGYALLCWSLPGLSFFIWTFCNLVPRALSHHRWYRSHFTDYPAVRKAVLPYIL
jgi:hypothetical protein